MNLISSIKDAVTIVSPSEKAMADMSTGSLIEGNYGTVGVITQQIKGKPMFKKLRPNQMRMYAEHSWAVRTAIDIHRNIASLVEPKIIPVDKNLKMDQGVKRAIEDLFSQRMSNGDTYAEVKEKMLEDYFVLSHGVAELYLKNNNQPYNIIPLDAARIGFIRGWDGTRPDEPRYAEVDYSGNFVRWLPDLNVMTLINRKRTYDPLGVSHVEVLDTTVQALLAGDDHLLQELQYPAASGALSLGEGVGPDKADEVRAKIATSSKWQFIVMSGTKDPKFIPFKPRDIKMLDKQVWFVRQVCAIFGIPLTALAQSADSTRANTLALLDQMSEGLKDTVTRVMNMENNEIVQKFGPLKKHNCRIAYPILNQKDATKQAELTARKLADQPYITINEGRMDAGLDPLPDPLADDVLLNSSTGIVPLSQLQSQIDSHNAQAEADKNPPKEPAPKEPKQLKGAMIDGELLD